MTCYTRAHEVLVLWNNSNNNNNKQHAVAVAATEAEAAKETEHGTSVESVLRRAFHFKVRLELLLTQQNLWGRWACCCILL